MISKVRLRTVGWGNSCLYAVAAAWLLIGAILIPFDETMQTRVANWGQVPIVNVISHTWSQLGGVPGISLFLLLGLLTIRSDRGRTLLTFVVTLFVAGVSAQVIKHLVGRVRPTSAYEAAQFVGPFGIFHSGSPIRFDSLPSGHTTAAFAMAVVLCFRWPRFASLWLLLASGVAVSRVLANHHFPSDVIFGSLLGTLVGAFTYRVVGRRDSLGIDSTL